jgi:hypothetical protein
MTFLHSGYNSKINLSAKQMLEISQEISRNFTPCFSSQMPPRVEKIRLTPRELLDIGEEIRRNFAPKASCKTPELMLLPVDPRHLFVYWNLGKKREIATPDNDCKDQLTLRIYSQPDEQSVAGNAAHWFDVAVDSPKTSQQVSLPDSVNETVYSAAIGLCRADDSFIEFAHSNIIHAPCGSTEWHQGHENLIFCLSNNASGQGISK